MNQSHSKKASKGDGTAYCRNTVGLSHETLVSNIEYMMALLLSVGGLWVRREKVDIKTRIKKQATLERSLLGKPISLVNKEGTGVCVFSCIRTTAEPRKTKQTNEALALLLKIGGEIVS